MTLNDKIKAGEPLMQQAMDAMRRYHEARDSFSSTQEVERLRLEAQSLMLAVSEYQQNVIAGHKATHH